VKPSYSKPPLSYTQQLALLQQRELAVVLTERVRQNASIDWTIKESVKAKLKVIVKRTLRHFGYPPDMQKLATDLVLRQAEMLAGEFSGG
jgi:type I restriction enzyme, R subunit